MIASKSVKARQGRPRVESVGWAIEIIEWEWNFMFGIQTLKSSSDPYFDYRHLNIRGVVCGPDEHRDKPIEISCSASTDLNERDRQHLKPKAVGGFSRSRGVLSGHLGMPEDALQPVLLMLTAKRYRFVIATVEPFERGDALVRDYYFSPGPPDQSDA